MTRLHPIAAIVAEHVEESASLRQTRSWMVRAPDVGLVALRRHDARIAAHLDGVAVAGELGSQMCMASLPDMRPGQMFTAAVRALEDRNGPALDLLLEGAESAPALRGGLLSAFGWVSAASLRDIVARLSASTVAFRRMVGVAACGMHQVDAAAALDAGVSDADPALRGCALRLAGSLGLSRLRSACREALSDDDPCCRFQAARSAILLGERGPGASILEAFATQRGPFRIAALVTVLKAHSPAQARDLLGRITREPNGKHAAIRGVGMAGDARYVEWLIGHMDDPALARAAGESFSFITGLDLAGAGVDGAPPAEPVAGPAQEAMDEGVAMDLDEGLPWPGAAKLALWWQANGGRFPEGTRLFMGRPVDVAHCMQVLRHGYQRQRMAAAEHLCLLQPGSKRFPTSAPGWRQQRWLDAVGA